MTTEELQTKINEFQHKLDKLQQEKAEYEKQLIILEEQYKTYESNIQNTFNTTNPDELQKILEGYLQEIENLESKLNKE